MTLTKLKLWARKSNFAFKNLMQLCSQTPNIENHISVCLHFKFPHILIFGWLLTEFGHSGKQVSVNLILCIFEEERNVKEEKWRQRLLLQLHSQEPWPGLLAGDL